MRATRRLGELLDGEVQHGGQNKRDSPRATRSLADLGVTPKQSHIAQQIASIPADEIEVRATRRLGELLADDPRTGHGGDRRSSAAQELDSLADDLGLPADRAKKISHIAQQIASIPAPPVHRLVTVDVGPRPPLRPHAV